MKLKIYLYADTARKKSKKSPAFEFEGSEDKCKTEFKAIYDALTKVNYSDIKYIKVFDRVVFEKDLFKSVILE